MTKDEIRGLVFFARYDGENFVGYLRQAFPELTDIEHKHVYRLAYEQGHASGYYEIFSQYEDLFDMLQDIKEENNAG